MQKLIEIGVLIVLLAGCGSTHRERPIPNDPYYAPVIPDMPRQKIAEDGSIFHASMANNIYSDVTARRIGDIITVNLRENTTALKIANTRTLRETEMTVDPVTGLGGDPFRIGGEGLELSLETANEFLGDAQSNQQNSLNGSISVTVMDVLPNGNLVVRGEKWMTLNNGDEYIRLTGILRPQDISTTNEVDSNKVANARIEYSGTGDFAQAQSRSQGWLTRFFSSDWWPF